MRRKGIFLGIFVSFCVFFRLTGLAAAASLTLEEAVKEAGAQSLVLKQAEEKVRAAEADAAEQRTYLLPSFSLSGSNAYYNGYVLDNSAVSNETENDVNTVALTVNQPLFTGGRLTSQYRISRLAVDYARSAYDIVYLDLILNVKKAYFNVLRLEKSVNVSRELVGNRQRHLSELEKRVKVGVLPKVEQLKAEVELAHSRDAVILAEQGLAEARGGLNRLLERPPDAEISLTDIAPGIRPEANDLKYYYTRAQQNRPERRAAEIKVGQAEKGKTLARSGYFPQVSLQLIRQEFQEDAFESGWSRADEIFFLVSCDIWNWGRVKDRVRSSRSRFDQEQLGLSDLERAINLEVQNAYGSVVSAKSRMETAQKAVSQAEEVLRIQSVRFKEGMATNTEVLDADFALAQAKTDHYNAFYDYLSTEAVLKRSIGDR